MTTTPKLLPDVPHLDDRLGGAHKKLAASIVKLIHTSEGGKSIRLEGTWGAGKSTVVNILATMLEQMDQGGTPNGHSDAQRSTVVFQYNAWVHVGDPLRRAFMSALLKALDAAKWISFSDDPARDANWERELAKLGKRLKISRRKTQPEFDAVSKLSLGALIALGVVSPIFFSTVSDVLNGWDISARFAFASSSWLVLTGLLYFFSGRLLNLITKRSSDTETTETREEAEPTSIEFQNVFESLMTEVLCTPRKLVIVIDNLDRIEEKEASEVWTLLRSFLDNPGFASKPWFKSLWVLVPLAGNLQHRGESAKTGRNVSAASPASHFDKIFQVRFAVPPPLLHSWKNYLAELLEETFGKDESGDHDEILRLYEELPPEGGMTPRAIVSFVNRLVAAMMEWDDAVPLSCLAAYELSLPQLDDTSFEPPKQVTRILPIAKLRDIFAMLHYRASGLQDASYITAIPEIEKALDAASGEQLKEVLRQSDSSRYVLDRYIREELPKLGSQQERFLQALHALDSLARESQVDGRDAHPIAGSLRRHLVEVACATLSGTSSLHLRNENFANGITAFISIVSDDYRSAEIIVNLLASLKVAAGSEEMSVELDDPTTRDRWTGNLVFVLELPNVQHLIDKRTVNLLLPIPPAQWANIVDSLQTHHHTSVLKFCWTEYDDETLMAWLCEGVEQYLLEGRSLALLKQLVLDRGEQVFRTFSSYVAPRMTAITTVNPSARILKIDLAKSVIAAFVRDFSTYSTSTLQSLARNGALLGYLSAAIQANQLETMFVFCIAHYIGLGGKAIIPTHLVKTSINGEPEYLRLMQGNATRAPSDIAAFCDLLVNLRRFDLLPSLVENDSYSTLGKQLTVGLASNERFIEAIAGGSLDIDMQSFVERYIPNPGLKREFHAVLEPRQQKN